MTPESPSESPRVPRGMLTPMLVCAALLGLGAAMQLLPLPQAADDIAGPLVDLGLVGLGALALSWGRWGGGWLPLASGGLLVLRLLPPHPPLDALGELDLLAQLPSMAALLGALGLMVALGLRLRRPAPKVGGHVAQGALDQAGLEAAAEAVLIYRRALLVVGAAMLLGFNLGNIIGARDPALTDALNALLLAARLYGLALVLRAMSVFARQRAVPSASLQAGAAWLATGLTLLFDAVVLVVSLLAVAAPTAPITRTLALALDPHLDVTLFLLVHGLAFWSLASVEGWTGVRKLRGRTLPAMGSLVVGTGLILGVAHTSAMTDPMLRTLPSALLFGGTALVAFWVVMMLEGLRELRQALDGRVAGLAMQERESEA